MIIYDSGADGYYLKKWSRQCANLPLLCISTNRVGVANQGVGTGVNVTTLPFPKLSNKAAITDTFNDYPPFLMVVEQVSDDNNISIFTKDGVTVHNKQDWFWSWVNSLHTKHIESVIHPTKKIMQ